jgi:hypothetical protein
MTDKNAKRKRKITEEDGMKSPSWAKGGGGGNRRRSRRERG